LLLTACATDVETVSPSAVTPTIGLHAVGTATPAVAGQQVPLDRTVVVDLRAQGSSEVNGRSTLSEVEPGKTHVQVLLTGTPDRLSAAIYRGDCAAVQPEVRWQLEEVVSGASTTTLQVNLAEILSDSSAIVLSRGDSTIVACGTVEPL
jgi:hypothetical protein